MPKRNFSRQDHLRMQAARKAAEEGVGIGPAVEDDQDKIKETRKRNHIPSLAELAEQKVNLEGANYQERR